MAEKAYFVANFVDIYTINELKLVIFANFIVLGEPIFDQKYQKVKFLCDGCFKINERSIINWFKFLKKLYNYFNPISESEVLIENNKTCLIYTEEIIQENELLENKTNCFYYKTEIIEEKTKCVTITSTYLAKPVTFSFQYLSFMELYKAFSAAFFKIYGYTSIQNLSIEYFIKSSLTPLRLIKNGSFKDILTKVKNDTILDLTINECFKITELIIRHRLVLSYWKESTFLQLDNVEDDSDGES